MKELFLIWTDQIILILVYRYIDTQNVIICTHFHKNYANERIYEIWHCLSL